MKYKNNVDDIDHETKTTMMTIAWSGEEKFNIGWIEEKNEVWRFLSFKEKVPLNSFNSYSDKSYLYSGSSPISAVIKGPGDNIFSVILNYKGFWIFITNTIVIERLQL